MSDSKLPPIPKGADDPEKRDFYQLASFTRGSEYEMERPGGLIDQRRAVPPTDDFARRMGASFSTEGDHNYKPVYGNADKHASNVPIGGRFSK